MSRLREILSRLNRLQRTSAFKLIASAVIVLNAIGVVVAYAVVNSEKGPDPLAGIELPPAEPVDAGGPVDPDAGPSIEEIERSDIESGLTLLRDVLALRRDWTNVALGAAIVGGLALVVVWLGLGLSYLGLLAVGVGVAYPLDALLGMKDAALLVAGVVALTASFTALLAGLRVLFGLSHPVFAIARNALNEAVRMKISLVFIVLLIFGLAALPGHFDPGTPLRYRVQSFLQYGTSGAFWLIALLVLTFAAASVAFEQRDKIIWQTMTKPVSAAQYVLGKWLGVAGLAAALLVVCASAIFLFTEHLRGLPAQGEVQAYVARDDAVSYDRLILEQQVLMARKSVEPEPPTVVDFDAAVQRYIDNEKKSRTDFVLTEALLKRIRSDLYQSLVQSERSIAPGQGREFFFTGLGEARRLNRPLNLKFRIDAGSNRPDEFYTVTFYVAGAYLSTQRVGLGPSHNLSVPASRVNPDGTLVLGVANGDTMGDVPNPNTMSFPPGGLQLSYAVGGYRGNFVRVALVLWIKLAFLAILAIFAATFLSFPVACMVAIGTFLAAESAGFVTESLQYYSTVDEKGNTKAFSVVINAIALGVSSVFKLYADLKPTTKLVDGKLLGWPSVSLAIAILGVWSLMLYIGAVQIFKRRELATYSGQ